MVKVALAVQIRNVPWSSWCHLSVVLLVISGGQDGPYLPSLSPQWSLGTRGEGANLLNSFVLLSSKRAGIYSQRTDRVS